MREHVVSANFLIPKKDGTPYHVLLCEDKEINQLMAIHAFEELGCLVDIASDGEQALNMALKNEYDVIFMDCAMPNMDGYEATTRIRKFYRNKRDLTHVPIIALTAKVMLHDREKCLETGMDDYISKPVRKEVICDIINKWCSPESNIIFYKNQW